MSTISYDTEVDAGGGEKLDLNDYRSNALLIVNVASKCGLTPQYEQLEEIQQKYKDRGLQVIGFPCNQFKGQEPGTHEEILEFCSSTYGISFPIVEKVEVNGEGRHPLYEQLTQAPDSSGNAGDIEWNFEKFLVAPGGKIAARFRPRTLPDADEVIEAIESVLPAEEEELSA